MPLSDVLVRRAPVLAAYEGQRQANEMQGPQQLQQALTLSGLIDQQRQRQMQAQEMQRKAAMQAEYHSALQAAGDDPEKQIAVARRYGDPKDVLNYAQSSLDRKAQMQQHFVEQQQALQAKKEQAEQALAAKMELAQQAGADRRTLMQMQLEGRREIAGMMAAVQRESIAARRDAQGNQPPVAVIGPDGKPRFVSRSDAIGMTPATAEKPMTEFQGKSSLYGTRAAQSDKILKTLEDKISLPRLEAARSLGRVGNYLQSSEGQRVDQAQRDFVNAVLRQESGAVISDAEFENAKKQYFPQPGDDSRVIEQKRSNRQLAIQGFARMAGSGASDIKAISEAPLLPSGGTSAAPEGVDPKVWNAMTPAEQALWKK